MTLEKCGNCKNYQSEVCQIVDKIKNPTDVCNISQFLHSDELLTELFKPSDEVDTARFY